VTQADTFFLQAAGRRLRAQWIEGPDAAPRAPCLVFLHEGLGSIPQWRDFPHALCRMTGLPGLVYERWGFGGSERLTLPRPKDYITAEAEVALPEVLAACGISRPVLIGHSDGGSIALLYAAAYPDNVAGVISEAAHVFVEDVGLDGIREAEARWRTGDLRERLARYHGENTETMFRGWTETWLRPEFRAWRITDSLPLITAPLMVIQGADDEYGTPRQVETIASGVSGPVETYLVPDCGHSPHLDAQEQVLERMAGFITRLIG
jgi:pimeloyl-ACP methyl ester carboxylesterase